AILPLSAVMRRIPTETLRAARSLGANGLTVFGKIYWPLSLPGVMAAGVTVFTLALGFYVTPALVGGGADQMLSASIAFYVERSLSRGMAAALSLLLLITLLVAFAAARLTVRAADWLRR